MKIKILEKIPPEKRLGFGFIVGTTFGLIVMAIASGFKYGL
jgi:hypothetical protein